MNVPNAWPPAYCVPSCGGDCSSGSTNVTLGYTPQVDAFGRLRVSQPFTLFDSNQRYTLDDNFVSNTASGGSVTYIPTQSSANLTVTNTTGSYVGRETKYVFTYQPGKSILAMMTFVMAPASDSNLRQRVGYFGTDNGFFLELRDQLYIVQRSNVSGTIVETSVPQSQWNYDTMTGYGPSGYTLDITKSQIFWLDMEWLGAGNVRTGFIINGQFFPIHIFQHANLIPNAYITTGTLPIRYEIESLTGSGPVTSNLTQICSTIMSEGGYDPPFQLFSNLTVYSSTLAANTWTPVMSIRLVPSRLDAVAQIRQVDLAITSGTTQTIYWALWGNLQPGNLTNENFVGHGSSTNVQIDRSATAMTTTNSVEIASGLFSGSNQTPGMSVLELSKYYTQLARNSFTSEPFIITLGIYSYTGISGGGITIQTLLSWNELL